MKSPRVTVLLSVYNGLPYLPTAIESILSQTYRDLEFLIVDDASTDGSTEMIKSWAEKDSRITLVINRKNKKLGHCLRAGVEIASGTWIARMDADDISYPDRLERQVRYIDQNPDVDIVGGWASEVDDMGVVHDLRRTPMHHHDIYNLLWSNPFIHPTVMFRKEAILRAGSYRADVPKRQDYELWFRCGRAGLKFANIPEPLIYYRFTDDWYRRNSRKIIWNQVVMGWKGCHLIKARPYAYFGTAAPLLKTLVPKRMGPLVHRVLKRVDPRSKSVTA